MEQASACNLGFSPGPSRRISESFPALLQFLATDFPTARLIDPGNTNNVVSDLLSPIEKSRIALAASMSLSSSIRLAGGDTQRHP